MSCSDAGGIASDNAGSAQIAYMVMAAEKSIMKGALAKTAPICWSSSRAKRVIHSTLSAETLALSKSVSELEYSSVIPDHNHPAQKCRACQKFTCAHSGHVCAFTFTFASLSVCLMK